MTHERNETQIIASKLYPQRVPGYLLNRLHVLRELENLEQNPRMLVLVAPAGYGKSTRSLLIYTLNLTP